MEKYIFRWGKPENPTLIFIHGLGSNGLAFGEAA